MRLIDADELMEHVWRDKLDSRELIGKMIDDAPTVKEISTKIPINVFEQLISQEPKTDFEHKAEVVISQLRADRDRLQDAIEKIKSEIKEWYWQADKQALAKDPCVVDAMVDLFIRTINKYTTESEKV